VAGWLAGTDSDIRMVEPVMSVDGRADVKGTPAGDPGRWELKASAVLHLIMREHLLHTRHYCYMRTTADAAAKAAVIQHFELFGVLQVFLLTDAVLLLSTLCSAKR
jgi:hypothetical protein